MSAERPGGSWKITLPCTRAEAEAIDAGGDLAIAAVLMTTEVVRDDAEAWRLDAYVERAPDAALLAALQALVPSAAGAAPAIERLGDEDWVAMSQAGLAPLRVGRFFVHAGDADPPPGTRAFRIAAGRAFGTGHHETTSGCLAMLDALAVAGDGHARIVDIGTGTGLLAFAAAALWPDAAVTATDIDPVAIAVTRRNAADNGVAVGGVAGGGVAGGGVAGGGGGLALIVADGALDDAVLARAPYDLIVANILAGPLVSMAPELAAIADADATIVLAGLLETQRAAVVAAYAACGCTLAAVDRRGDWSVLRLTAGAQRFIPAGPFDPNGRDGWALDI